MCIKLFSPDALNTHTDCNHIRFVINSAVIVAVNASVSRKTEFTPLTGTAKQTSGAWARSAFAIQLKLRPTHTPHNKRRRARLSLLWNDGDDLPLHDLVNTLGVQACMCHIHKALSHFSVSALTKASMCFMMPPSWKKNLTTCANLVPMTHAWKKRDISGAVRRVCHQKCSWLSWYRSDTEFRTSACLIKYY